MLLWSCVTGMGAMNGGLGASMANGSVASSMDALTQAYSGMQQYTASALPSLYGQSLLQQSIAGSQKEGEQFLSVQQHTFWPHILSLFRLFSLGFSLFQFMPSIYASCLLYTYLTWVYGVITNWSRARGRQFVHLPPAPGVWGPGSSADVHAFWECCVCQSLHWQTDQSEQVLR